MALWLTQIFQNINNTNNKRNCIAAAIAGLLFFTGWWAIINVAADPNFSKHFHKTYYICGVLGTLSMFMINVISNAQLRGEGLTNGCLGEWGARMWLFIGFGLGFGSVIAGGWILFQAYVIPNRENMWPGIAVFIQNFFIFSSALTYRFGRTEDQANF